MVERCAVCSGLVRVSYGSVYPQRVLIRGGGRELPPVFSKNGNNFVTLLFQLPCPFKSGFSSEYADRSTRTQMRT